MRSKANRQILEGQHTVEQHSLCAIVIAVIVVIVDNITSNNNGNVRRPNFAAFQVAWCTHTHLHLNISSGT